MKRPDLIFVRGILIVVSAYASYERCLQLLWRAQRMEPGSTLEHDFALAVYLTATIVAALSFSTAVVLVDPHNFQRVAMNSMIMLTCTFVGLCCGDPLSRGSYDHFGGLETVEGQSVLGITGAVVGYVVVLARRFVQNARQSVEGASGASGD